jgi:hypothetical protein
MGHSRARENLKSKQKRRLRELKRLAAKTVPEKQTTAAKPAKKLAK